MTTERHSPEWLLTASERAVERDELLQVALNFIETLTGMQPPPIEIAPPEVFAPFQDFVDRIQAVTDRRNSPLRKQKPPTDQQIAYAKRYEWLRSRDLDAIGSGGVFAGMTPENVVVNGEDLDAAVDAAIGIGQAAAPQQPTTEQSSAVELLPTRSDKKPTAA